MDQFWRKKIKKIKNKIFILFFALLHVLKVEAGWCLVGLKSQFKGLLLVIVDNEDFMLMHAHLMC